MSTLNAFSLIASFSEAIVISRKAAGTYASGVYVDGATTTINAAASVQPLSGREQLSLPELQHGKEVCKIYTSTPIYSVDESVAKKADIITLQGKSFEVQRVEKWEYSFSFYKALLVRLES